MCLIGYLIRLHFRRAPVPLTEQGCIVS